MGVFNMEEEKPKLRLSMLNEKPVDTGHVNAGPLFNGDELIKTLVFNTTTKEDFSSYTENQLLTANIAVLNKLVTRLLKLRPDEFAKMIKDELDGKVWFR